MNKNMALLMLPLLLAGASAGAKERSDETAIPFVRSDGIQEWKAASDDSLWILGGNGRWYLVRTMGSCPRLKTAQKLGFRTSAGDQLDRFGAIYAEGMRCTVESVTRSDPPPPKAKR
jgi:Family of unknown function (DUF6491)